VWNRDLADLVADGSLRQIGIVLEQHPDRARLFAQWQQMDWPIYADALDLLDLEVVPRSFLLDARGIVVAVNPTEEEVRGFVDSLASAGGADPGPYQPYGAEFRGAHEFLVGNLPAALSAFGEAAEKADDAGRRSRARFRLGVARMAAAEQPNAEPGLFAAALEDWRAALAANPSQYVWRRRIQQYGPRLDKPYSFYDWVATARAELSARGETPATLHHEPSGAELAVPRRGTAEAAAEALSEPDPARRMPAMPAGTLRVESAVVAGTQEQPVVRVHLLLTPVAGAATWNDEGEATEAWLRAPAGWELVDGPSAKIEGSSESALGDGTRRLEFELRRTSDGAAFVEGYVLLDLCLGEDGVCMRLRQDFRVTLP